MARDWSLPCIIIRVCSDPTGHTSWEDTRCREMERVMLAAPADSPIIRNPTHTVEYMVSEKAVAPGNCHGVDGSKQPGSAKKPDADTSQQDSIVRNVKARQVYGDER